MIRRSFLNKVTLISALVLMVGCSSDLVDDDIINQIEAKRTQNQEAPEDPEIIAPPIEDIVGVQVLMKYDSGTDKFTKAKIRRINIDSGLLLAWRQGGTENTEIWVVGDKHYFPTRKPKIIIKTLDEEISIIEIFDNNNNINNNNNSQSY